ncbi:6-phosphogluconate dehydrogenase C-terminal domain-like protein [Neolentinus lepideus HHB14362 ss-1]|uniref:2-dehydropantoate 2-reductase n=1 Tax=Neolentinus lepideus HHB14362 ss-1 TaxID=1314782 RepID=A0A165VAN7_9AGAM|nr:6-phosphogluconate dehydrogenase C-terminal domain-like protein [Neolentinus lepideus HHB14362 ss-1]
MLDICVVGLGAIGTIYSYALERSGRVRVTAVCRSNYDIVYSGGLNITSDRLGIVEAWKPYRVVASVDSAADRNYRFVVCSFKCLPDVQDTPSLIRPLLSKTSAFVLVQNGIGIERTLRKNVPETVTIISGCAWIDATTVDGGNRVHQTGDERLTIGYHSPANNHPSIEADARESIDLFADLLRSGGCNPEVTNNIDVARWRKVLWNASFSTLCTLTRGSCADLMSADVLSDMLPVVRGVMTEVISVARKAGVEPTELPDDVAEPIIKNAIHDYSDIHLRTGDTADARVPSAFKPSMLVDLEAGRPIEVEPIIGGVIRQARELAVETPRLDLIYATLKVIQRNTLKARKV